MGFRFFLLNFLFLSLFGLLGFHLYQVQVVQNDYYFNTAQARVEYVRQLQLRRGRIFFTDKHNNDIPVAINKDYPVVFVSPKEMVDREATAQTLGEALELDSNKTQGIIDNEESLFFLIIDKATPEQIEIIRSLDLEGVYIDNKQYRFYPYEDLASQALGFVGVNKNNDEPVGLYGIELLYDKQLSSGEDVYLTIDRSLQSEADKILKELVEAFNAAGGSVIIQNPITGEILALANQKGFDPNKYGEYPVGNFVNSAVQYVYEPGSVFKPITMATGIDLGVITPETTFYDTGELTLNGHTIRNWDLKAYGEVSMTRVIERSINTGAAFAGRRIGKENFLRYLEYFGFGELTKIDLPNEVSGSLNNLKREGFREIDLATASFGQGTAVTPVQLINAYSSIANGGLLMRPYLNREDDSYPKRRVIERSSASQVSEMMRSAVEKAYVAAIDNYNVAGKTGTAQIPDFQRGGYSDSYIHTFVGFAPVSNPKFTILIKLDKPEVQLAGHTVVPAFKELAQFVINYYNIPPDNLPDNRE